MRIVGLVAGLCLALGACGSDPPSTVPVTESTAPAADQRYPEVVAVELVATGADVFEVAVTVSSPYDTPERYADAWRVLGPEGDVLGERILTHDHASEQPFTRVLRGVFIDASIAEVTVEARDLINGWGGGTVTSRVPR